MWDIKLFVANERIKALNNNNNNNILYHFIYARIRKGREIFTGRRFEVITEAEGVHKLAIMEAGEVDAGMYTVLLENESGKARSSAELYIQCK